MALKQALIAAVSVGGLMIGAAGAQPMEGGWHHGGEGIEILHNLNLSDAQKQQAETIEHAAWAQARPIMGQMHAIHDQLAAAILQPGTVTAADLAPMVQKEELLKTQLDQQHLNTVLQIRALLTPEQVAQAATMHQKLAALHAQEHQLLHGAD